MKESKTMSWALPLAAAILIGVVVTALRPKVATVEKADKPGAVATNSFSLMISNAPVVKGPEEAVAELIAEGNTFLGKGDFAAAVRKFQQAVAISPEQEDLHYNLAIALAKLGKKEEAKASYLEALRIFPEYAEAHNNLGNLFLNEGNFDEAAKRFRAAIQHMPENSTFHNNLGTALARQRKMDEALPEFEEAVKLDQNYVEARVNLANALLSADRINEAVTQANEALRLKPDFLPAQQTMERARQRLAREPNR